MNLKYKSILKIASVATLLLLIYSTVVAQKGAIKDSSSIFISNIEKQLDEIEIVASPFKRTEESPLSLRTIKASELYRSPGGNRDVSKVMRLLPGVATTSSYRNDIIIRGGGPNENRFFIDGIEVPNINHFSTQGSSGGPVGMLNVTFIEEVDLYTGAFPANRGNMLSSIMEIKQREVTSKRLKGNFTVGSSDIGLALEGKFGENAPYMFSIRRSYLQFLFKFLKLPFLPTYNDMQFKQKIELSSNSSLSIIGLGAFDYTELNLDVNDNETDQEVIDKNRYLLGNLPTNDQWNYTVGAKFNHIEESSYIDIIVSRNHLSNSAAKYRDNIESDDNRVLDYTSEEIENKFRVERTIFQDLSRWKFGGGYQLCRYSTNTLSKQEQSGEIIDLIYSSDITINRFALFASYSTKVLKERLSISAGIRTDFNDYSTEMSNPIDQLSPRVSLSYSLSKIATLNGSVGRYFQLPPYTVLGYRDGEGNLVNRVNDIGYIMAQHISAGVEIKPTEESRVTVEGFFKDYQEYPFLLTDSISLANMGGDFGVIGNEPAESTSDGRSYGVEVLIHQRLSRSIYGIASYTWVRSEFKDKLDIYRPSSWDNKNILNVTAGYRFGKGYEVGLKFRYQGGSPYTPYDIELSSKKEIWDVVARGIPDWDRLNEERGGDMHGLDFRLDRSWLFSSWALELYIDIENIYNSKSEQQPYVDVVRDDNGLPISDPVNPDSYLTKEVVNESGTLLPSIGVQINF